MSKKEEEIIDSNDINNELNYDFGWLAIISLIFAFAWKPEEKLEREDLLEKVNKSDLSNLEKRKIMEILLG